MLIIIFTFRIMNTFLSEVHFHYWKSEADKMKENFRLKPRNPTVEHQSVW